MNNKEIKEGLKIADHYMKEKNYMGALLYYNDIFNFHQEAYYHKAYFGLYLAWWNLCKDNKNGIIL